MLSETPNAGFIPAPLDKAVIEIGGPRADATIDELRISSVARPPAANPGPYQPDTQTLLLDHFDDYGDRRAAEPSPLGKADSSVAFVPAKFGKGPSWEPANSLTQVQWLASLGVRTICFHEHWSPYQSHPSAGRKPATDL